MVHVMDELRGRYPLQVAFSRYRRLQILWAIDHFGCKKWRRRSKSGPLWGLLSPLEKLTSLALAFTVRLSQARFPKLLERLRRRIHAYGFFPEVRYLHRGDYSNVIEIFEALRSGQLAVAR